MKFLFTDQVGGTTYTLKSHDEGTREFVQLIRQNSSGEQVTYFPARMMVRFAKEYLKARAAKILENLGVWEDAR